MSATFVPPQATRQTTAARTGRTPKAGELVFDTDLSTLWVGNGSTAGGVAASSGGGSGTVTSVGLTLPASILTVSGSPVTTSGTLTAVLATQTANTVFSGPTTGSAAAPTFRALVAADVPAIAESQVTGLTSDLSTLSTAVALRALDSATVHNTGTETVAGAKTFSSPIAGSVTGTAANVTGTVAVANGGTGQTAVGTANQVNGANAAGTAYEWKTITAGANVTVTHGVGTVTIAAAGGGTAANPTAGVGLTAVNGSASTYLRSDGAPALDVTIAPTWTGVHTFSPAARSSGVAPYLTVTAPADTTLTASTEAVGVSFAGATRQHATGALTTQREFVIGATTYSFVGASTITTAVELEVASPIAGTNATLTKSYAIRAVSSAPTHVPLVAKGAGSQSGDLFQAVDSADSVKAWITSSGKLVNGQDIISCSGQSYQTAFIAIDSLASVVFGNDSSTALQRTAQKVISSNSATYGKGWLQSSAGRARLTADATNATATAANLTDLSLTLIAGRKYTFKLVLFASNSDATEGLQFDFNGGTATMTSFRAGFACVPPGSGLALGTLTTTALGTALTATTATTGDAVYTIEGAMVANAAGTFIPRFAEVSHTAGTATVRLGSFVHAEDMPA